MQDMPPFTEMPDSARAMMKASIEQARNAFDMFIGNSQVAMGNFQMPPNVASDGLKQLNDKIAEFTKLNADANFRLAMKLADAKHISDVIEIQNQHARELMETFTKQLEELRELTARVVQDSAKSAADVMPNPMNPAG
ncbi:MAG: phasin family protein [Alphaproteobacteria bacterium]